MATSAETVLGNIVEMRDQHHLFMRVVAVTSKRNKVQNIMAFKRRDALRLVLKEYEAVRKLLQLLDIKVSPISKV